MTSELMCHFSPWPGLLCGRGVIFSAVCECLRGAVMHVRAPVLVSFSF